MSLVLSLGMGNGSIFGSVEDRSGDFVLALLAGLSSACFFCVRLAAVGGGAVEGVAVPLPDDELPTPSPEECGGAFGRSSSARI